MFFGDSNHTEREEKVLEYIIHRMSKGTRLHDVMQEAATCAATAPKTNSTPRS